jgi:hypothetical protein
MSTDSDPGPQPGEKFWSAYLEASEGDDRYLPGSWEANTTGILTFVRMHPHTMHAGADQPPLRLVSLPQL